MTWNHSLSTMQLIMTEFADRTGITGGEPSRRYLWTDAFAVCNFLELHRRTGDDRYLDLALRLIDLVHHTLGRHRPDDPRAGWISGLDDREGEDHPTRGGLRIGKELPERRPGEPMDPRLEWERDGQYYHYLTKWMHALSRVGRVTGDHTFNRWAAELAKAAHHAFVYQSSLDGPIRMVWKMSIDLSRPLVTSMGQHDPLDGAITYYELEAGSSSGPGRPGLDRELEEMLDLCEGADWVTDDALGLGGLLIDAYRLGQLIVSHELDQIGLLMRLLDACVASLTRYRRRGRFERPARFRLPFRELGLAIGLQAALRLEMLLEQSGNALGQTRQLQAQVEPVTAHRPLHQRIEGFWLDDAHREPESWMAHRDINAVMLATSISPDSYVSI